MFKDLLQAYRNAKPFESQMRSKKRSGNSIKFGKLGF